MTLALAIVVAALCVWMLSTGVGVRQDTNDYRPPATIVSGTLPPRIPRVAQPTTIAPPAPPTLSEAEAVACARVRSVEGLIPVATLLSDALRGAAAKPDDVVVLARTVHLIDEYRLNHLPTALEALRQLGIVVDGLRSESQDIATFFRVAIGRLDPIQDGQALSNAVYDLQDDPEIIAANTAFAEIFRYGQETCGAGTA